MNVIGRIDSTGSARAAAVDAPGAPVPLEPYRSQKFFELEREKIFRRAWLNVGRVEDVPNRGDFVVREVEILRASAIIAHGKDGEIRAFYNTCPHRGNRVVNAKKGSAPAFVCGYHAWTFSNDGSLRGVPDEAMFQNFDKASCGLRSIALEIFDGWIFINFADPPEVSLKDYLGEFGNYIAGLKNINNGPTVSMETYLKCNWKVASDAFLEAYHVQSIHSTTLQTMYSPTENRFGRPLQIRLFGAHGVNSMYGNTAHQAAAHQKIERVAYDPSRMQADHIESIGRFMQHPAVNPTRSGTWSMDKNQVFPNTQFDFGPTGFWTHQFWPISVGETRHVARFYIREPLSIEERFAQEYGLAHAVDIVLEDLSNVERTQLGIDSGAFDSMTLSDSEVLIRRNVEAVLRWTQAETVSDALEEYAQ